MLISFTSVPLCSHDKNLGMFSMSLQSHIGCNCHIVECQRLAKTGDMLFGTLPVLADPRHSISGLTKTCGKPNSE